MCLYCLYRFFVVVILRITCDSEREGERERKKEEEERMKVSDMVCVVTGAGSGIGLATSMLFAENGAKVHSSSRSRSLVIAIHTYIDSSSPSHIPRTR